VLSPTVGLPSPSVICSLVVSPRSPEGLPVGRRGTGFLFKRFSAGVPKRSFAMPYRDIVAIGTSAGGVEALLFLASRFSPTFPASILVTIHLSSHYRSNLDVILSDRGQLLAGFARDGELLQKSRIYIAPPERHLIVDGQRLWLGSGPQENRARPAIDPMLRSTAVCCCARTIGVILTGTLGDGAAGLSALHQCGGITVVQDPTDAAF